jgi:hypothetical protein
VVTISKIGNSIMEIYVKSHNATWIKESLQAAKYTVLENYDPMHQPEYGTLNQESIIAKITTRVGTFSIA